MRLSFVRIALSAALPLLFSEAAIPATAPAGQGIDLAVTIGTDPSEGACGTDTTLAVTAGDQINYCYTVTNNTDETLAWHTLSDDVNGPIFIDAPITIAPGATYQYNRVAVATASEAPVATWTAYDVHPDYAYTDAEGAPDTIFADGYEPATRYAFVDISQTGTSLALNDDDYTTANIGFPFTFYGRTASSLTVSNNGGILFDQAAGTRGRQGYLSPVNRTLPDRMIGPSMLVFWDDMSQDYIDGIGNVLVQTIGDAPNRRFVVEWFNLPISFGGGETTTYEAILFEGSNDILFQYKDVECGTEHCDDGASATIGLNEDREHALLYSFDTVSVSDGKAILFTPTTPDTYTATASATLDVGAPVIGVDPGSFTKTVASGTTTTDSLTISNTGDRDLSWNIGSIGTRSHFPPVSRFALPVGDPSQTQTGPAPIARSDKHYPTHPFAAGSVPAYASDLVNASFVSFDATSPSTLTLDVPEDGNSFLAGDFKGEDFSTLYAIDFLSFDLYKVDTATGARTLVYLAVPPPGAQSGSWNGMAWDRTTSTMYAVTIGGRPGGSSLVRINPDTGDTEYVAEITGVGDPDNGTAVIDIAVDTEGHMYGVEIVTDTLVAIDKETGEASTIGSIGFDANFSEGLDFDDATGTLYFSGYDNSIGLSSMYTIDTETGLATPIDTIGPDPSSTQYAALGIARLAGICAYPDNVPWLSFDTTRGSTQPDATTPITVTFDATTLSPGTYTADICVNNNDLTNPRLAVPVTLTVD
jgi:hypothetical protein